MLSNKPSAQCGNIPIILNKQVIGQQLGRILKDERMLGRRKAKAEKLKRDA